MDRFFLPENTYLRLLVPLIAGASLTVAFAPFECWFALIAPLVLLYYLDNHSSRRNFLNGLAFGIGFFATGVSWVYISIHRYGDAHPIVAVLVTALFVAYLGLYYGIFGYLFSHFFKRTTWIKYAIFFPALWVLLEWVRGWFLTGFPWLFIGYSVLDTPLEAFAPIVGIYGLSFIVCFLIGNLYYSLITPKKKHALFALISLVAVYSASFPLKQVHWTAPDETKVSVSLVQANIPQDLKWQQAYGHTSFQIHENLSKGYWQQSDIVIWPEAAITYPLPIANNLLKQLQRKAARYGHSFITGIPKKTEDGYYHNGLVALSGNQTTFYAKYHLVPFGEYVPFKKYLASLLALFNVPATMTQGPLAGSLLQTKQMTFSPAICYEVAYPERFLQNVAAANALITVSNDTWFGHSIGPHQHMEIARMRALEAGRPLIRATNNGITALVDHNGKITKQAASFIRTVLTGEVTGYTGLTPIARIGQHTVLWIIFLVSMGCFIYQKRNNTL